MPKVQLPTFIREFRRCDIPLHAAALAYHSLLSLIPLSGLMFWLLSSSGASKRLNGAFRDYMVSQLNIAEGTKAILVFERLAKTVSSKTAGALGVLFLFVMGWRLLTRLGNSIDAILQNRTELDLDQRRYTRLFIRRIGAFATIPIALLSSLAVSSWAMRAPLLQQALALEGFSFGLRLGFSMLVTFLSCYLVYLLAPRIKISTLQAMQAALFATVVLEIAKGIVSQMGSKAFAIQKMYGALAALPLLMVWLQIVWIVLLSGVLVMKIRR